GQRCISRIRRFACNLHQRRKGCDQAGIDAVVLGAPQHGLRESAHLAWLQQEDGEASLAKILSNVTFVTTGGLQTDAIDLAGAQQLGKVQEAGRSFDTSQCCLQPSMATSNLALATSIPAAIVVDSVIFVIP